MTKYLFLIFISMVFIGCSTMGETSKVVKGKIFFVGGVDKDGKWDESLEFKRTSWFQKAKMSADILLAEVDNKSPFSRWLGDSRDSLLKSCSQFYVALLYTNDFRTLSRARLTGALKNAGLREVNIPKFKANIQAHLTTNEMNLEKHKVTGFCASSTTPAIKSIWAIIPGFTKVDIL
jgi:hypothetical protein